MTLFTPARSRRVFSVHSFLSWNFDPECLLGAVLLVPLKTLCSFEFPSHLVEWYFEMSVCSVVARSGDLQRNIYNTVDNFDSTQTRRDDIKSLEVLVHRFDSVTFRISVNGPVGADVLRAQAAQLSHVVWIRSVCTLTGCSL